MSTSRWARLLAGSATLRHALGSTLRPASSSTLLPRLRGASAQAVRLLRAELGKVRQGSGLQRLRGADPQFARGGVFSALLRRLRPASEDAGARLRAASTEVMTLFRDELAALSVDAVLEDTRLPEETSHIVGPRLRALGEALADVLVDRNKLSELFHLSKYVRRKRREQRRPPHRRPPPAHLVPRPAPPANWRSLLAPSALRRPAVAVRPLPHPSSSFLRPWHMPPALLGPRTN